MDVSCKECGQNYHIPDYKVDDRRLYFNCEKCSHKIVVENRRERWNMFSGFSRETFTAKDVLEGVFFSFNWKNLLTSMVAVILSGLIFVLGLFLFRENAVYFAGHPGMAGFVALIFFGILISINDTHLYLVSRNTFHNIREKENISYRLIGDEMGNDLKSILFLTVGSVVLLTLFLLPAAAFKQYGDVYIGIVYPFLFPVSFVMILVMAFRQIFIAFFALRSRSFRFSMKSLFRFIVVENLNLLAYSLLSGVVYFTGIVLTIWIFSSSVISIIAPGFLLSGLGVATDMQSVMSMMTGSSGSSVLLLLMVAITGLLFVSYLVQLSQVLSVAAVYIMEKTPGRSVNRTGILIVAAVIVMAILSVTNLLSMV